MIHHSPICSCKIDFTGDPFSRCYPVPSKLFYQMNSILWNILLKTIPITGRPELPPEPAYTDPCVPSPCGPYSQCRNIGNVPSCSCLAGYIGAPPNCHPECLINAECSSNLACFSQKCQDPCPGSCGLNAECHVTNHIPICQCPEGFIGDPFSSCYAKPQPRQCIILYFWIINFNDTLTTFTHVWISFLQLPRLNILTHVTHRLVVQMLCALMAFVTVYQITMVIHTTDAGLNVLWIANVSKI